MKKYIVTFVLLFFLAGCASAQASEGNSKFLEHPNSDGTAWSVSWTNENDPVTASFSDSQATITNNNGSATTVVNWAAPSLVVQSTSLFCTSAAVFDDMSNVTCTSGPTQTITITRYKPTKQ